MISIGRLARDQKVEVAMNEETAGEIASHIAAPFTRPTHTVKLRYRCIFFAQTEHSPTGVFRTRTRSVQVNKGLFTTNWSSHLQLFKRPPPPSASVAFFSSILSLRLHL